MSYSGYWKDSFWAPYADRYSSNAGILRRAPHGRLAGIQTFRSAMERGVKVRHRMRAFVAKWRRTARLRSFRRANRSPASRFYRR